MYNGGTPTFGYTIDSSLHYQLNPHTAPVVLEIFTMYDQGKTMTKIALQLHVNKSTVSRTLARGRARLKKCLKYSF